ncbi:MAG: hypothetical protein F4X45_05690 [Chloroflexi bacterium]|nr:hypothetical protein [Chloroflexota bacterium]
MDWSALWGYLPELTVMAAAVAPFIKPGREWLSSWLGRKRKRSAGGQSDAREGGRRSNDGFTPAEMDQAVAAARTSLEAVNAYMSPLVEVGIWDNYFSVTGPSASLEEINATIVGIIAELTADGPADADLARAKSVMRDDYQLDSNGEIISPLLRRRHLDDALVGTPEQ